MISLDLYRQRIGLFKSNKYKVKKNVCTNSLSRKQMKINSRITLLLCLILLSILGTRTSADTNMSANHKCGTNTICGTSAINIIGTSAGTSALGNTGKILKDVKNISFNYFYETTTWNKLMHIINGNIRRNITLGHWNGGSSYIWAIPWEGGKNMKI